MESYRLTEIPGLPEDVVQIGRSCTQLSPPQCARVAQVKTECEGRLASISDEALSITHPRLRIELRAESESIRVKIQVCDSLLSSMRLLPVEILGEIFAMYLGDDVESDPKRFDYWTAPKPEPKVTILSEVCRMWHAAVLGMPALWPPIRIYEVERGERGGLVAEMRHVQSCLRRMDIINGHPWSLDLDIKASFSPQVTDNLEEGKNSSAQLELSDDTDTDDKLVPLSTIFEHPSISTLKSLDLLCNDDDTTLLGFALPSLESLALNWTGAESMGAQRKPRHTPRLPNLPKLSKAVFAAFPNGFFHQYPYAQLTHLYIGGIGLSTSIWMQVMEACVSLKRGCFNIQPSYWDIIDVDAMDIPQSITQCQDNFLVIDQPGLLELTLHFGHSFDALPRLPTQDPFVFPSNVKFRWPSLRKFKFITGEVPVSDWLDGLLHMFDIANHLQPDSLVNRSAILGLTSLTLTSMRTVPFDTTIASILESTPFLEELFLHFQSGSAADYVRMVEWFATPGQSATSSLIRPGRLPHLRALGFHIYLWHYLGYAIDEDDDNEGTIGDEGEWNETARERRGRRRIERLGDAFVRLVTYRTRSSSLAPMATQNSPESLQQPTTDSYSLSPFSPTLLENLVIRLENEVVQWGVEEGLKKKLKPFAVRTGDDTSPIKIGIAKAVFSEGHIPEVNWWTRWVPWDQGFLDFSEHNPGTGTRAMPIYSPYPTDDILL